MPDTRQHVHATSADAVAAWLSEVEGARIVAVDTETTGWDPWLDDLLLVQVSAGPAHPVLVLDARLVAPAALSALLADRDVLKVFHHGSFDLRFLSRAGLRVQRVADTMLAQQLLDGGEKTAQGLGLAALSSFRLGMELDKSVRETFAAGGAVTDAQIVYAADDAAATWGVFDQQWRELVGHGLTEAARIEFAALPVLAGMQLRGVPFDAPRWREVVGRLEGALPALEEAVQHTLVTPDSPRDLFGPTPVNLDAPEQVRAALARVGVAVDSTRESLLRDHRHHPAVAALLSYRQVAKITSSWGGDWADRALHPVTGRVHPDWRQIVGTGRISCTEPSLLQIPKEARYRSCFGGQEGRAMIVADYSQQELRILAAVSGDEALTDLFRSGGDLHTTTAAMVFGVPEDAVQPQQRSAAKQLNFGLMYGMGAPGFARATGTTIEAARATMDRYFAAFPRVAAWLHATEAAARRSGRVRTPLGRLRVLPADAPASLARNAPIQGAGADMTKIALAEVGGRLDALLGTGPARDSQGIVLVVHDEIVVDVAQERVEEARAAVEEGMLVAARRVLGDVPAAVEATVQERWGRLESLPAL